MNTNNFHTHKEMHDALVDVIKQEYGATETLRLLELVDEKLEGKI